MASEHWVQPCPLRVAPDSVLSWCTPTPASSAAWAVPAECQAWCHSQGMGLDSELSSTAHSTHIGPYPITLIYIYDAHEKQTRVVWIYQWNISHLQATTDADKHLLRFWEILRCLTLLYFYIFGHLSTFRSLGLVFCGNFHLISFVENHRMLISKILHLVILGHYTIKIILSNEGKYLLVFPLKCFIILPGKIRLIVKIYS